MSRADDFTFNSLSKAEEKLPLANGAPPQKKMSNALIAGIAAGVALVITASITIIIVVATGGGDSSNTTAIASPPPSAAAATAGVVFSPSLPPPPPPPAAPGCCTEALNLTEHPCASNSDFYNEVVPKCENVGIGVICEDGSACSGDNNLDNCPNQYDYTRRVDCGYPPSPPKSPPPPSPSAPGCCTEAVDTAVDTCPPNSDFVSEVVPKCENVGMGVKCEDGAACSGNNELDNCEINFDYVRRIPCSSAPSSLTLRVLNYTAACDSPSTLNWQYAYAVSGSSNPTVPSWQGTIYSKDTFNGCIKTPTEHYGWTMVMGDSFAAPEPPVGHGFNVGGWTMQNHDGKFYLFYGNCLMYFHNANTAENWWQGITSTWAIALAKDGVSGYSLPCTLAPPPSPPPPSPPPPEPSPPSPPPPATVTCMANSVALTAPGNYYHIDGEAVGRNVGLNQVTFTNVPSGHPVNIVPSGTSTCTPTFVSASYTTTSGGHYGTVVYNFGNCAAGDVLQLRCSVHGLMGLGWPRLTVSGACA